MNWLLETIEDACLSSGGPFGALIVKDDKLIARGTNLVVPTCDPTAHAEIVAIRRACQVFQTHNLSDCVMYASCEPCPMCLAAILWANISKVYFAATRKDAASIGFKDAVLHDLFQTPSLEMLVSAAGERNAAVAMMKSWKGEMYG